MRRAIALVGLVACKSSNFVEVDIAGIPCGTTGLRVDIMIDDVATTTSFANDGPLFVDGSSSFALDMQDHPSGLLTVTITAEGDSGLITSKSNMTTLPSKSLTVDFMYPSCNSTGGVDASSCWAFGFIPTNFNPCDPMFPPVLPASRVLDVVGTMPLDTDDMSWPTYTFGSYPPVRLVHVDSFTVEAGATLNVTGSLPLLIVVDQDATVSGTIALSGSTSSMDCTTIDAPSPGSGTASSPGGGGGGFGETGGDGGKDATQGMNGGAGGAATGTPDLSPLHGGCSGGAGGKNGLSNGGPAGEVPGAIEISSQTSVTVNAEALIAANGGGGAPGESVMGPGVMSSGGGAGSSGGGIFLEAPTLTVNGALCAVGGGGGEGGFPGGSAQPGGTIVIACAPEGGGGTGGNAGGGGEGGNGGGVLATGTGRDGEDPGLGSESGGGGGGGGPGRIHFHGMTTVGGVTSPHPQ